MTEKGTYSDPRCYACGPDATDKRVIDLLRELQAHSEELPSFAECMASWAEPAPVPFLREALDLRIAAILRESEIKPPKPYHEGRYSRLANRMADAINKHVPAPDVESDVLRRARSE